MFVLSVKSAQGEELLLYCVHDLQLFVAAKRFLANLLLLSVAVE